MASARGSDGTKGNGGRESTTATVGKVDGTQKCHGIIHGEEFEGKRVLSEKENRETHQLNTMGAGQGTGNVKKG